ncbi:hypothetical protein CRE_06510 [Caenorhabditis remanei]|uniref:Uncharacterized protein n=1 Tax=Caenorhabditis remanei TaxID=31234 RepID=E3M184_CAERE|nr:hypothetical protein CRE_06510 [Caenorhabditis remanei]
MSQSTNSNADHDVMVIGEVPAASSAQETFAAPFGLIRHNIGRGRFNPAPQGRPSPYPLPRARGSTNSQNRGASQNLRTPQIIGAKSSTPVNRETPGMAPYNYAAIQAAQTRQAQEAERKRQCEEGKAHCSQEILKLQPKIAEVRGRVNAYNEKFVKDIEKDKFLRRNYNKILEAHSEKLEESIKKECKELDGKFAETANQEELKRELKELERLQKLRKMMAENPHFEEPAPESKAHDAKQIRQTLNKFGFGTKMTQDLEELRKAIAAFSKTEEQNVEVYDISYPSKLSYPCLTRSPRPLLLFLMSASQSPSGRSLSEGTGGTCNKRDLYSPNSPPSYYFAHIYLL